MAIPGTTLTYAITISNAGPSVAQNVTLIDTIPACILSPQYSLNGVSYLPWTGSINVGTIGVNVTTIVYIRGLIDSTCTGTLSNTAIVQSITPDTITSNNTSTVLAPLTPVSDIRIVKGANPIPVVAGTTLTFTMTITNNGPSAALNVTLTDTVSACVLSPQYSLNGVTYVAWPNNVNLGTLGANSTQVVFIRGIVDPNCTGTIVNTAIVTTTSQDTVPNNNTSTVTVPISRIADLSVVKGVFS